MTYDDFDLQIEPAGEKFRVRLLNAPTGQATTEFVPPFTEIEVANFLSRIGQVRRTMRRVDAPELQAAKEFGGKLFGAIFSGEMIAQLRGSMEQASDKDHGLRIRLRLTDVPSLADLPWEFLYDANQNHFLTTSTETPVVRFLDLPQRIAPLRVALPLRVLVMIASPRNLKRLDTEGEWARLQESLGDLVSAGQLVIERLPAATLDALRLRARGAPFHVFHFIGHGGFDEAAQDGVLQFEDESGMSYPVRGEMLGMQLHDHRSLRLAVLNACEGARSSRQDPFSGVAQSLLQQRVPAVIAMQFEISDAAAKVFALEFYRAVAEGNPVDAAVCESRKALFKEEFGQEWATPVLYMRSQEGQLFELQAVVAPPFPDKELKKRELEEAQKQAAAKAEDERAAKEEKERLTREKKEQEQLALEKAEADRQAAAKAEAERVAALQAEAEHLAQAEKQRREQEKAEQDFLALARVEAELRTAETIEAARAANAEKERQAKEAAEAARSLRQQEEAQRRAKERLEYERLPREKVEADRRRGEQAVAGSRSPGLVRSAWLILLAIPILGLAAWVARSYQVRRAALRNPELHFQNGEILRAQKNFSGAVTEYREAIRLKPDYPAAHAGLANALADKGELDNAIREFREIVRLNPSDASAHQALGELLSNKGELDAAKAEFLTVMQLKTKTSEPLREAANNLVDKEENVQPTPDPAVETPPKKSAILKVPPTRVRQGGIVRPAKLLHRVEPTYPPLAAQAHVSGTVRLHANVGKDGSVLEVEALSGPPLLLQSAMNAVKQWRYSPALLNGHPVEVDTTIDVEFHATGVAPSLGAETKGPSTASGNGTSTATTPPPAAKSPCTFGKVEFSEQGNRLVGNVPYTYQGSYPLDAVALRGIPLKKDKQQVSGLTYGQSTLKAVSGTAPFSVEGHPTLNRQEEESFYLVISIVVKQNNALVCGELVPYQRKW
ncbi:MAG: hypothetical protein DMG55_18190 [Acidobacteria bacterium]|nr:MAG: hypothetical protein DMG55_18190 [Acidobacteriota bacterium]